MQTQYRVVVLGKVSPPAINKKLRYRRETARHAMSVKILTTAAQPYEKSHLKGLQ